MLLVTLGSTLALCWGHFIWQNHRQQTQIPEHKQAPERPHLRADLRQDRAGPSVTSWGPVCTQRALTFLLLTFLFPNNHKSEVNADLGIASKLQPITKLTNGLQIMRTTVFPAPGKGTGTGAQ